MPVHLFWLFEFKFEFEFIRLSIRLKKIAKPFLPSLPFALPAACLGKSVGGPWSSQPV
jgi:hypothetical protein